MTGLTGLTNLAARLHDEAMAVTPYEKTMNRAFKLLSFKPRSIAELRERLLEKVWAEEAIVDQVIARLIELRYLDDEKFAASYASSRLTVRPLGRTRLRRDLQKKKIPNEVTEQTLNEIYNGQAEEELIDRAVSKRLRLKGPPQSREEVKKLFDYLMRRGFNYQLALRKAHDAAKGASTDDSEDDLMDE